MAQVVVRTGWVEAGWVEAERAAYLVVVDWAVVGWVRAEKAKEVEMAAAAAAATGSCVREPKQMSLSTGDGRASFWIWPRTRRTLACTTCHARRGCTATGLADAVAEAVAMAVEAECRAGPVVVAGSAVARAARAPTVAQCKTLEGTRQSHQSSCLQRWRCHNRDCLNREPRGQPRRRSQQLSTLCSQQGYTSRLHRSSYRTART
jgi:hypothetical protein